MREMVRELREPAGRRPQGSADYLCSNYHSTDYRACYLCSNYYSTISILMTCIPLYITTTSITMSIRWDLASRQHDPSSSPQALAAKSTDILLVKLRSVGFRAPTASEVVLPRRPGESSCTCALDGSCELEVWNKVKS